MGEFAVGQPVPRFEDPRLLRGGGRYVDDMVLPRMAFGHVLRSPYAHARIRRIDVAQAKAAPGVLAVLIGADWQAAGWGDLPVPDGMRRRGGGPMYRPRFPALVTDRGTLTETPATAARAVTTYKYSINDRILSHAGRFQRLPIDVDVCAGNIAQEINRITEGNVIKLGFRQRSVQRPAGRNLG